MKIPDEVLVNIVSLEDNGSFNSILNWLRDRRKEHLKGLRGARDSGIFGFQAKYNEMDEIISTIETARDAIKARRESN